MLNKNQCLVWIISGPSGSGKTSLATALLKDTYWKKRLMKSISSTTRPLRSGEKEGRDYHHICEKEFLKLRREGAFLESEKMFGFYYGTPKRMLSEAKRRKKDLLLCIDVKGAQAVKRFLNEKAVSIFILAPDFKTLTKRLKERSTENKKDLEKRLRRVKMELSYMKDYDYVIVNDNINTALKKIKCILTTKNCKEDRVLHSIRTAY